MIYVRGALAKATYIPIDCIETDKIHSLRDIYQTENEQVIFADFNMFCLNT